MPTSLGISAVLDRHSDRTQMATSVRPEPRVVTCYELLDLANEAVDGGIEDFTDGIYPDATTSYADAQALQANWLLDQVHCVAGTRLLDIGCGNGRLLRTAQSRGAHGVGITISPKQVARCQRKRLDVQLLDYRDLDPTHLGHFDCLVANGSIEHFVQAADAAAGRSDAIYRRMFAICRRMVKPRGDVNQFATTVIHFGSVRIDPREMAHGAMHFRWGSDKFHYALLVQSFGGFYPLPGQLEQCAKPHFELVDEQDGTDDYRRTSEHWLSVLKQSALHSARFRWGMARNLARQPIHTLRLLTCLLVAQSWNWQFRGDNPPMRLLRQVWKCA